MLQGCQQFFPCTARLWNSLPVESFPLTYDLILTLRAAAMKTLPLIQRRIQRFFGHTVTCTTNGLRETVAHLVIPY